MKKHLLKHWSQIVFRKVELMANMKKIKEQDWGTQFKGRHQSSLLKGSWVGDRNMMAW